MLYPLKSVVGNPYSWSLMKSLLALGPRMFSNLSKEFLDDGFCRWRDRAKAPSYKASLVCSVTVLSQSEGSIDYSLLLDLRLI